MTFIQRYIDALAIVFTHHALLLDWYSDTEELVMNVNAFVVRLMGMDPSEFHAQVAKIDIDYLRHVERVANERARSLLSRTVNWPELFNTTIQEVWAERKWLSPPKTELEKVDFTLLMAYKMCVGVEPFIAWTKQNTVAICWPSHKIN